MTQFDSCLSMVAQTPLTPTQMWMLQHLPAMVFVFMFGACVGSFTNVLNYRLPAGMSVISPPSRCPTCGGRLRFIRENLPILGWFMVRGRCRYCKARISPEYMLVELFMALLFLGLYWVLFDFHSQTSWWGQIGGRWWTWNTFFRAWPAYFVFAALFASLVSMTMIDARTFTIPIQIPVAVTVIAFVLYPLQTLLPWTLTPLSMTWMIPCLCWPKTLIVLGGMVGIALSCLLLRLGVFRYSFADYEDYVKEDEVLAEYPHARREMKIELLFLLPCILGMVAGGLLGRVVVPESAPPEWLQALVASMAGYLMGGGLVWGIRIIGSLAFGREAMGMGDVHLLGAVGAVLGWFDPFLIFFIAPFFGIAGAILSMLLGSVFRRLDRALPYGPYLALATVMVILCRPLVASLWLKITAAPMPVPGFCP